MTSRNVVLEDVNGDQIYPITLSENVFTGAGVTLKETLENLDGGGSAVVIDTELSDSSTNPVQNKVVHAKFEEIRSEMANMGGGVGTVNSFTYHGSGTYGESNPTQITFEKVPKLVSIVGVDAGNYCSVEFIYGMPYVNWSFVGNSNEALRTLFLDYSEDMLTLSLKSDINAGCQFNTLDNEYTVYYIS